MANKVTDEIQMIYLSELKPYPFCNPEASKHPF